MPKPTDLEGHLILLILKKPRKQVSSFVSTVACGRVFADQDAARARAAHHPARIEDSLLENHSQGSTARLRSFSSESVSVFERHATER